MYEANLSGADLSGTGTKLSGTALSLADFSGAALQGVSLKGALLNITRLVGANLNIADMSGATLFGADLTGADLSGANLSGAMLIGANLSGADLRGADLSGAVLLLPFPKDASSDYYENLTGDALFVAIAETPVLRALYDPVIIELNEVRLKPHLKDAQLNGVIYNLQTKWPDGFDIPPGAILSIE